MSRVSSLAELMEVSLDDMLYILDVDATPNEQSKRVAVGTLFDNLVVPDPLMLDLFVANEGFLGWVAELGYRIVDGVPEVGDVVIVVGGNGVLLEHQATGADFRMYIFENGPVVGRLDGTGLDYIYIGNTPVRVGEGGLFVGSPFTGFFGPADWGAEDSGGAGYRILRVPNTAV